MPALRGPAGEERSESAGRLALTIEKNIESGECGAEFAGMEEMIGIVRAFVAGELEIGESFVEEMAAGTERAFDLGK